jgi:16S rRNA (guanine527-N7)-methyltransferase
VTLDWNDLPGLFPGLQASDRWLPLLQRHLALISAAGPHGRATGVAPGDAVRRNYAESLELLRIIDGAQGGPPLVDIGPGAGFPGLIIAAVQPAWEVHLLEPLKKRATLLEQLAAELGLPLVTVHPIRAEEAARGPLRETAATVTARAVAPLRELLEYATPLAMPGGLLALPKGSGVLDELAEAPHALTALRCEVEAVVRTRPEASETPYVVLVRKAGPTPRLYPRRPGIPHQRPL